MITKQGEYALFRSFFYAFLVFLILFALLFVWCVSNLKAFVSKITYSTRIVC